MCQLQEHSKLLFLLLLAGAIVNAQQADEFPQCASVELDTFIAVADECSSYIYCNGENSFRDTCPAQTYFDGKSQECAFDDAGVCLQLADTTTMQTTNMLGEVEPKEEEEQAATTTEAPSTPPAAEATPEVKPAAPAGSRPHCDATGDGYHPHPDRCEYYYSCLAGYLSIVRCPYKFGWDYAEGRCKPMAEAQCFSF
ncbi:hypothetical protein KR093_009436 [Drosophila rubida]|uniref:Chitin-binding type-2 domain-containing protein n=1 Tax=Drosophila rubida TaxID=30044 RepID=A0AAD4K1M7_9MUSC|nr:hypothetical protein KR093_009436 [Drosophila rubida]